MRYSVTPRRGHPCPEEQEGGFQTSETLLFVVPQAARTNVPDDPGAGSKAAVLYPVPLIEGAVSEPFQASL